MHTLQHIMYTLEYAYQSGVHTINYLLVQYAQYTIHLSCTRTLVCIIIYMHTSQYAYYQLEYPYSISTVHSMHTSQTSTQYSIHTMDSMPSTTRMLLHKALCILQQYYVLHTMHTYSQYSYKPTSQYAQYTFMFVCILQASYARVHVPKHVVYFHVRQEL